MHCGSELGLYTGLSATIYWLLTCFFVCLFLFLLESPPSAMCHFAAEPAQNQKHLGHMRSYLDEWEVVFRSLPAGSEDGSVAQLLSAVQLWIFTPEDWTCGTSCLGGSHQRSFLMFLKGATGEQDHYMCALVCLQNVPQTGHLKNKAKRCQCLYPFFFFFFNLERDVSHESKPKPSSQPCSSSFQMSLYQMFTCIFCLKNSF